MYRNWASDETVTKYLTWAAHKDMEASKGYITYLLGRYGQPDVYEWCIELKEIGQPVGSISVVSADDSVSKFHIGYCIGQPWWQKGITSEAFSAVIRFLMEEVGANRVEARHDPRNENSGKVMQKCGLSYEGTHKKSDRNNQGVCDAVWYAILREEYFARKQAAELI